LEESGLPDHTSCNGVRMVPSTIDKALLQNPQTLINTLQTVIGKGSDHNTVALFLDQMEELFGGEAEDRQLADAFLSHLFGATRKGVLTVIATIRSDLLHHCYGHADMLTVLKGPGHYPKYRKNKSTVTRKSTVFTQPVIATNPAPITNSFPIPPASQ
jgi:hypothetical protein